MEGLNRYRLVGADEQILSDFWAASNKSAGIIARCVVKELTKADLAPAEDPRLVRLAPAAKKASAPAKTGLRVIVAGSRQFESYARLKTTLDDQHKRTPIGCVVSGTAAGADLLGEKWALERGIPVERFPADWKKLGKKAGFVRNEVMAKNADALIAFHVGESKGTAHMITTAKKAGLKVRVARF